MAVMAVDDIIMDGSLKENEPKAEAFFKNAEEMEIQYPKEIKSMGQKKKMKEALLREHPETLLLDYSGPENKKVCCNLLFFTNNTDAWHCTLLAQMNCSRKGGICKGRQLTLEVEQEARLTINIYHNGTVLIQGPEAGLSGFQAKFGLLKREVQKVLEKPDKKDKVEEKSDAIKESCLTSPLSQPKAPTSPRIRALQDNFSLLEQDYFLFKEETINNICQLQEQITQISNPNEHFQHVCSAMRQLEEANKEMRRELTSVKQELSKREQHTQALESQLEEMRTELKSYTSLPGNSSCRAQKQPVNPQMCTAPSSTTPQPTQSLMDEKDCGREENQRRPSLRITGSNRSNCSNINSINSHTLNRNNISNRHSSNSSNNNSSNGHVSSSHSNIDTSRGTSGEGENIIILCDSNGNHLNQRRLFPGRTVMKLWCPTVQSAVKLLREGGLEKPSHIIVHTGTNDLSTNNINVAKALVNLAEMATNINPSSKIIISTILPRKDIPTRIIESINREICKECERIPNVYIAHHANITREHLYDRLHIHEGGMKLFAKVIKDTALNRKQKHPAKEMTNTHEEQTESQQQTTLVGRGIRVTELSKIEEMLTFICEQLTCPGPMSVR